MLGTRLWSFMTLHDVDVYYGKKDLLHNDTDELNESLFSSTSFVVAWTLHILEYYRCIYHHHTFYQTSSKTLQI
jgi:hypothetical protein